MNASHHFVVLLSFLLATFVLSEVTNVDEFIRYFKNKTTETYTVGFLTDANAKAVKRYMLNNMNVTLFQSREELLKAIDSEAIIAAVTTNSKAQDLGSKYHVFSSNIVSPQAMFLAPNFDPISVRYGLKNRESEDLFQALNAAIIKMQIDDDDEKLFSQYERLDITRAYTCRQDSLVNVINRNQTTGYLREILFRNEPLRIGGLGPKNWGVHDGNYEMESPTGLYPDLLKTIVKKLAELAGSDNIPYSNSIDIKRSYYSNDSELFQALLNGTIHATDVYLLIDVSYSGPGESCKNDSDCLNGISCINNACLYSQRPRSLFFRNTCTVGALDSKFITKKNSITTFDNKTQTINSNTNVQRTKSRWVGYLLLLTVLFGTVFLILLIFLRRKTNNRFENTAPGGFGKFVRLQEESEPNMEVMDSFDDQIIQSPRETNNPTS